LAAAVYIDVTFGRVCNWTIICNLFDFWTSSYLGDVGR